VPTYVLLLRGINLGPKRRVAMADLRELLEGLGYDDVRTHLQSGNVVLRATGSAAALRKQVETALATHCGFDVDVVVRTKAQLDKVVAHDPFAARRPTGRATSWCSWRRRRRLRGVVASTGRTTRNWNVVTRLAELAAG